MPSFDVVSEINMHELTNAVDQANREVGTRFDFRGTNSRIEQAQAEITIISESDFQVQQIRDILRNKMVKRGIDIGCLEVQEPYPSGKEVRQKVIARQGIDKELAKKIVKLVKDSKIKVQAAIQGEQVRVTGKNRDDLQQVIALLKESKLEMPLQYANFRD
ncbi:MAG: YajQ family cyclic di-GMP-binding protein [Gammaproteobacteria bacterium]|nr:YajQ family cyclic di-GMP-binding protein [Gammaproteobacteria bacterium]